MDFKERVYSVLIVSSAEKFNQTLIKLLPESLYSPVDVALNEADARRRLLENSFDIVVVNTPLPEDFGTRLALDICESSRTGVLLLVRAEHYHDISARVAPLGVIVLSKPTTAQVFSQSMLLLSGTSERLRRYSEKNVSVEEKMAQIRTINRAKLLLIDRLKMTEKDAHRYIEKQAMDRCVTRLEVANGILSTYE